MTLGEKMGPVGPRVFEVIHEFLLPPLVSSDGKTRTVTFDGTDPQGHKVHNVVVFEKEM
jgi:hypothetical protein